MLCSFVVVLAVALTGLLATRLQADGALVPSWLDLWERCRVSIESRQPLDLSGLALTVTADDPTYSMTQSSRSRFWRAVEGGRFVIAESEDDSRTGSVRRCDVQLADWRRPLSKQEMERLMYAFLERRNALLVAGTHVAKETTPLDRMITSNFGPKLPNSAGCPVISVVWAIPEDGIFRATTGEQGLFCDGGQPMLPDKRGPHATI